ncbi:unnamed protein product [Nesidiocoris tenuis]|uniref:Uncharacterized protein n=2 Tax=Nesidiocoris tenuis TaxID=355587 RepID=A0A6H5H564_9HEMI|nr:unnamed protein product [Nesidiocoris tenuis]
MDDIRVGAGLIKNVNEGPSSTDRLTLYEFVRHSLKMMSNRQYMHSVANDSNAIREEIRRFESVHPSIYAIYDLIELIPDSLIAQQIRDHVVCIEVEPLAPILRKIAKFTMYHCRILRSAAWRLDLRSGRTNSDQEPTLYNNLPDPRRLQLSDKMIDDRLLSRRHSPRWWPLFLMRRSWRRKTRHSDNPAFRDWRLRLPMSALRSPLQWRLLLNGSRQRAHPPTSTPPPNTFPP